MNYVFLTESHTVNQRTHTWAERDNSIVGCWHVMLFLGCQGPYEENILAQSNERKRQPIPNTVWSHSNEAREFYRCDCRVLFPHRTSESRNTLHKKKPNIIEIG